MPSVYSDYVKDWRLRVDYTATPNYSTLKYTIKANLYVYKPFAARTYNLDGNGYYRLLSNTNRYITYDFNGGAGWYHVGTQQTATASAGTYTIKAYWYFGLPEESYRPLAINLSVPITLSPIAVASTPVIYDSASGGSIVKSSPVLKKVYIRTNTMSQSYHHTATYSIGSLSGQTAGIGAGSFVNSKDFTPPIELLNQLKNYSGDKATLTVELKTYSDNTLTKLIGTKTTTFTLTGTGYVSIDNGTSFSDYVAYVDDGTKWNRVVPYVDSGNSWNLY